MTLQHKATLFVLAAATACSADQAIAPSRATPSALTASAVSSKFVPGDRVQVVNGTLNVRATPAISGTLLGTQTVGSLGTVVGGPALDSTGDQLVRWQVNFDQGADGWAAEYYLTKVASAQPPPPTPSPAPVATVSVSPASATLAPGSSQQLIATLRDSTGTVLTGRTIAWTSGNTTAVTVSSGGVVTGLAAGVATVVATSEGKNGAAVVTVTGGTPVSIKFGLGDRVQVVNGTLNVRSGPALSGSLLGTQAVGAVGTVVGGPVKDAGGDQLVRWQVNFDQGADGWAAEYYLAKVPSPAPPPASVASVTVSPAAASVAVGGAQQLLASAKDSVGNVLTGRAITWTTGNAAIVSVNASGMVVGIAAGTATVTATSGGVSGAAAITVTAAPPPPPPGGSTFGHVFIVTEENTNYASVIGSSAMPYLNSLASQYGLATQYYAVTHPSIGNYFMLATGQVITNDDSYSTVVTVDNVVRRLLAAGKTWKSYAEALPSVGYTGGDVGNYARKHNVFALLSDVANDAVQRQNLVPFTQFGADLANGALPSFANIVPNLCNDAHDCSLGTADAWLQANIAPLIASPTFQQDGLLIILFDESGSDNANGGGRVVCVVVSPKAKRGYQSAALYQHQSTLRLMLQGLGVTSFPGAAAGAPSMMEFFSVP